MSNPTGFIYCFMGILKREIYRFFHQYSRFIAALVRPLVWLFVFAMGLRSVLGISIIPPYETYVLYEVYITPGLMGMILLFSGMQSSLSIVYDREMGSMRALLVSPFPRWFLLTSKLLSGVIVSLIQVYVFIAIASLWEIEFSFKGYLFALPMLLLGGMMMASFGLLLSSTIKQLENFAGVMNFIIFPLFFASSALYPLWQIKESSLILYQIASLNPFTHVVELVRFSLYGKFNLESFIVVSSLMIIFLGIAFWAYNPSKGFVKRGALASN